MIAREVPSGPPRSVWHDSYGLDHPALTGAVDVDIAIVGGGLTGITAAYLLSRQGRRVAVLEKHRLGAVATGLTTAFLVETIDTDPETLISIFGEETTRTVLASHRHALDFLDETVRTENIDCDFSRCPLYMYAVANKDRAMLDRQGEHYALTRDRCFVPIRSRHRYSESRIPAH